MTQQPSSERPEPESERYEAHNHHNYDYAHEHEYDHSHECDHIHDYDHHVADYDDGHAHDHAHDDPDPHHHEHEHEHGEHGHSHIPTNQKVLWLSFAIITAFMLVEAVSGYMFGSLALLADAGHMLNDSLSLGLAGFAVWYGARYANGKKLALNLAILNGMSLLVIAGFIVSEAIDRFSHPQPIASLSVMAVAVLGLVVNLVVMKIMQHGEHGGEAHENLNMRAAYAHVLADILGSVAAIVASLAIWLFHWQWADPLASLIVAVVVLKSGISVTWQAYQALRQSK